MRATYSKPCARCQFPIRPGDEIIRPNGRRDIHVTCLRIVEASLYGFHATLTKRVGE